MSLDAASIVALTLCLCACTSAVPADHFFDEGSTTLSLENEVNEMGLPSFGDHFVELIGCRDLGRIRVYSAGQVVFLPEDQDAEVENLVLEVFTVDYNDINKAQSSVHYRTIVPNGDFRTLITDNFTLYFPRRSIDPDFAIVVTWDLSTNASQRNLFQCVIVFDIDQNSVFIIYQYADNLIQWPPATDEDATFPTVGAEVCGGEDFPKYEIADSGDSDVITRVQGEIITGVQPVGRLAFLIDDGPNADGSKIVDVIYEHIPCADNVCDLINGDCEEANVCICNTTGWTGSDCKTPNCPNNPCINGGTCDAPHTCNCDGTGYTGNNCGTLQCVQDGKCKNGGTCLTDPLNTCSCPADQWTGATCETPICAQTCANSGICSAPNICSCPADQWTGATCETPVCAQTCANGGTCSAPNTCSCPAGQWMGATCETPVCAQVCMNGGNCAMPNTCQCTSDWTGSDCTTPVCNPACSVHGTCTAPNTCQCTGGYTGPICETPPPPATTNVPLPSPSTSTVTAAPTTDQSSTDAQLSAGAIGGIVGGIVGFVILLLIMGVVIIGAFCAL